MLVMKPGFLLLSLFKDNIFIRTVEIYAIGGNVAAGESFLACNILKTST
jgi:hypothetical protein